jgi:transketolase
MLEAAGVSLRIVSLPCWEAFFAQDAEYRNEVLGGGLPVASLEAGATFGWERITGRSGLRIGIDHFGASAPASELARQWGFTPQQVSQRLADWLSTVSG